MKNSRRIRIVGQDDIEMRLATPSWTRLNSDIEHEITIQLVTVKLPDGRIIEAGTTGCSCEDASFRPSKRHGHLIPTGKETPCKHQKAVIEGKGPTPLRRLEVKLHATLSTTRIAA